MLRQLEIENIALIEKMIIPFKKGLNVITGETGAGKSIIIHSLKLVLGGRIFGDEINTSKEKGLIQAIFSLEYDHPCLSKLGSFGLRSEEEIAADNDIVLTRELSKTGKNICRINGRIVPLVVLREIGSMLIDLQGQHEQQSLLKEENHLVLLDSFGDQEFRDLKANYQRTLSEYRHTKKEIATLTEKSRDKFRRIDMIEYQLKEIDDAAFVSDEDKNLQQERKVLVNSEKLSLLTLKSYQNLSKGNSQQLSVTDLLGQIVGDLQEAAKLDESTQDFLSLVEETLYQLEDVSRELKGYSENLEFSPNRLDEIENRLVLIGNLKRKYGDTIEEIFKFREGLKQELEQLEGQEYELKNLQQHLEILEERASSLSLLLSNKRLQLAQTIELLTTKQLRELDMPKVSFKIDLEKTKEYGDEGSDKIRFLISTNLGQPLKQLTKVASGGEMSRIFLALKVVMMKSDYVTSMVFDEIDAGLGGEGVQVVARKLEVLAQTKQVICITHSPQIAGTAEQHLFVFKKFEENKTSSSIKVLDFEGKVLELSRMLSGSNVTEITLNHAREILKK